jgi:hypothetical protein
MKFRLLAALGASIHGYERPLDSSECVVFNNKGQPDSRDYVLIHLLAEVGATATFLQHALHIMKLPVEAFYMLPVIV